jgi:hypothetical protein
MLTSARRHEQRQRSAMQFAAASDDDLCHSAADVQNLTPKKGRHRGRKRQLFWKPTVKLPRCGCQEFDDVTSVINTGSSTPLFNLKLSRSVFDIIIIWYRMNSPGGRFQQLSITVPDAAAACTISLVLITTAWNTDRVFQEIIGLPTAAGESAINNDAVTHSYWLHQ